MNGMNITKEQREEVEEKLNEIRPVINEALDTVFTNPFQQGENDKRRDFSEKEDNVYWVHSFTRPTANHSTYGTFVTLGFTYNVENCQKDDSVKGFTQEEIPVDDVSVKGIADAIRDYAEKFDVGKRATDIVGGFIDKGENRLVNSERYEPRWGSLSDAIVKAEDIKTKLLGMADKIKDYEQIRSGLINESALEDCIYEIYKENWLCENVPSAERLDIRRQYEIDFLAGDETRDFDEYINEEGYNGALYASREEFLTNEYEDREFVASLLNQSGIDRDTVDKIMNSYDTYKEEREEEIDGRDDI